MSEHQIRPLATIQDYSNALARLESLMELDRSASEDEEFDKLATLVENYEERRFPMDAPDPMQVIKFHIQM